MNLALAVFLFALALAIFLFWYLATDNEAVKRWVGTALTLGVTAFCLLGIVPPLGWWKVVTGQSSLAEEHQLKPGIDIAGGSSFVLEMQPPDGGQLSRTAVEQAMGVIRKRLNELGTADLRMAPRGENQIMVEMPGVSDEARAAIRDQLQKAAIMNFHLVHTESRSLAARIEAGEVIPGYELKEHQIKDKKGNVTGSEKLVVTRLPDLKGTFVERATPVNDPNKGWVTIVGFDGDGRRAFADLTAANVGRRLAVILDGVVVSAPNINEPIAGGSAEISGMGSERAATELANALQNPLEAPMEILEEQSVSATLGAESVHQGVLAGLSGFALTLLFLLFYYRVPGLVAMVGLAVNFVILLGIMAMFDFSFTLPGIAGTILIVGMAVDANVLIYERLKEEQAAGKSLGAAVSSAYDKAFSAIFDANVTTLITGAVLFWRATDAVRGFAVTLICGILGTLFASLIVSRVCFRWLLDSGTLKQIHIGKPLVNRHFNFLGQVSRTAVVSGVLLVVAIGAIAVLGNGSLGVDFKGGDLVTFQMPREKAPDTKAIESALAEAELAKTPTVQRLTLPGSDNAQMQVRSEEDTAQKVIAHLRETVPVFSERDAEGKLVVSDTTVSIGATMGKELLVTSGIALLLGLGAILLYLSVRFEFSFALGAIVALFHDLLITIGALILFGREMSAVLVGALLTVAGYSVNDTIIVFDRIREALKTKSGDVRTVMNEALNETLSRTLLTSLTTLFTLVCIAIFGGAALRDFSLALIIGIVVGTYSSIFVAAAFVLWWTKVTGRSLRQEVMETEVRGRSVQGAVESGT